MTYISWSSLRCLVLLQRFSQKILRLKIYRKFLTFHINLQLIFVIRFIVKTFVESYDNFTIYFLCLTDLQYIATKYFFLILWHQPKVHMSYCHHFASVVWRPVSINFLHFRLFIKNHWANQNTLSQVSVYRLL